MNTTFYIILLILIGLLIIAMLFIVLFILPRNHKVAKFRMKLIAAVYDKLDDKLSSYKDDSDYLKNAEEYQKLNVGLKAIIDKYTYEEMLYSFCPLKLENWFTKEEIELLNK